MTKLTRNENTNRTLTRSINELTVIGESSKVRRKVVRLCNRICMSARRKGSLPAKGWKDVMERTHRPVRDYARIYGRREN